MAKGAILCLPHNAATSSTIYRQIFLIFVPSMSRVRFSTQTAHSWRPRKISVRRAVKKFPEFLWLQKCNNWFNMIKEWPSWSWNKTLASLTDAILPNDLKMKLVSAKFVPCGFRITMTHRATHRLLCSNSSPRKAFLSSPNHRTLWISLRVTFGCSLFWKCASRGRVSHHGGHRIECDGWTPEDSKRSLPPVHPTMAGSMEQVCVFARVWLWRWLDKRCHISYHYSAIPQFRELCDCPS